MDESADKCLFFALWPDTETRKVIGELIARLRPHTAGKAVAAHNLHVTLVFLGSVDSKRQRQISLAASELQAQPISLDFDRLSFWRKPGIGCLTSSQSDASATLLANQLATITAAFGIAVDPRPYVPHVTLFRKLNARLQADFTPIRWQASDFCLVESCSTASGVLYRVLERWPVVPI